VGVCGQITPWNAPLLMATVKIAPALAAGCTVVLKPAELTPLTALRLGELLLECNLPEGVVNILPGYGAAAGQALVKHKGVDKIAFTGSTAVGLSVLRDAGIKRVTLELGGKSPIITLNDADMDTAVSISHHAVFGNSGQMCLAASRTYVQEGIYDKFLERATDMAKNRKVGDPFSEGVENGPLISSK